MIRFRPWFPIGSVAAALFVTTFASPAAAQEYAGAAGYGGGIVQFGDFNAGGSGEDFAIESGWVVDAFLEDWLAGGWLGARASGAFTRQSMASTSEDRNLNIWLVGADLMLRLLPMRPGTAVSPFVSGGVGLVHYALGDVAFDLVPENARYPGHGDTRFAVVGGAGLDLLPGMTIWGTNTGIRLEAVDNVTLKSPFEPMDDSGDFDRIHNIRFSLSLFGVVSFLDAR